MDTGCAALDAMITPQALVIAYIDEFTLLMIATLAVVPLLIVFKQTSGDAVRITWWNDLSDAY
jgi:hypothetical protein